MRLRQGAGRRDACPPTAKCGYAVNFRADPEIQARIAERAGKCNEGQLSSAERAEYERFVHAIDLISILQSKARPATPEPEPLMAISIKIRISRASTLLRAGSSTPARPALSSSTYEMDSALSLGWSLPARENSERTRHHRCSRYERRGPRRPPPKPDRRRSAARMSHRRLHTTNTCSITSLPHLHPAGTPRSLAGSVPSSRSALRDPFTCGPAHALPPLLILKQLDDTSWWPRPKGRRYP